MQLDGDSSEGSASLIIPFDLSEEVHAQCVNVMLERERVDVDGETSMLMSGVVETERLSNSISDMITLPLETEMKVEDKEIREEEEEEEGEEEEEEETGVNEREDRVRIPAMVLLTNITSDETNTVKLERATSDDPESVNAVEVSEIVTFVLD